MVLVRGQLRVLREEQGRAPGRRRGAAAPRHLPQAHARLSTQPQAEGRVRWAGPAFAASVLLSLYVLFWPSPAGAGVMLPGADKLVHAGLFALLTATAVLRLGGRRSVLACALAYAALSEVVQALLLPERSGDVIDLLADGVGAVAGWVLVRRRLR